MHVDIIKARWSRLRGKLQRKWPRLTDEDITQHDGHRDYLVEKLRERYGIAREKAEMQVKEFERSLGMLSDARRVSFTALPLLAPSTSLKAPFEVRGARDQEPGSVTTTECSAASFTSAIASPCTAAPSSTICMAPLSAADWRTSIV